MPGNEIRSEFMARVAYAELRWGNGAPGSGLDSDPGIVWLGYGPPVVAHTVGGDGRGPALGSALMVWRWPPRVQVQFVLERDMAEERLMPGVRARFDELLAARRQLERCAQACAASTPSRCRPRSFSGWTARTCSPPARVPTDRLARGMAEQGTLALELRIRDIDGRLVHRASSPWRLDASQRRAPAMRVWRHRLPAASYLLRVEAYAPVEGRGARGASIPASVDDAAFRLEGFGVSQVLVTQAMAPRHGEAGARWSDYNILPNPGDLHRNQSVSLLWEVYGDSATSLPRYAIEVTLHPPTPGVARALGAQARTAVIGHATPRRRERDRVAVAWTRHHALPDAVRVEQVDLGAVKVSPPASTCSAWT